MARVDLLAIRTQVRALLDEQNANLFSDAEINNAINKGAKLVTRESQLLNLPWQIQTTSGQSEYPCPMEVTDILKVWYFNGITLLALDKMKATRAPMGVRVNGARPTHYFVKPWISTQMNQVSTNDIVLNANSDTSNDWRSVIGIWPAPSNTGDDITIDGYISHPTMKEDTDKCLLPDGFEDCLVYYATFQGLLKAKFYAEASTYQGLYEGLAEELANITKFGNSAGHPKMVIDNDIRDFDRAYIHDIWVD